MISKFDGKYRFLSNFWLKEIRHRAFLITPEGKFEEFELSYPSVEHGYQASKTLYLIQRIRFTINPFDENGSPLPVLTAGQAKRAGKALENTEYFRKDWAEARLPSMEEFSEIKYQDATLLQWLLDTGDEELVEGNTWNDKFYGQCPVGIGLNHLGKILMRIRFRGRK